MKEEGGEEEEEEEEEEERERNVAFEYGQTADVGNDPWPGSGPVH